MKVGLNTLLWVVMLNLCAAAVGQAAAGASGLSGSAATAAGVSGKRVVLGTLTPGYTAEQMELNYQRECFYKFMRIVASEELEQMHPTPNRNQSINVRQNYSKLLGISENEERLLRIILLEGFKRDVAQEKKEEAERSDYFFRERSDSSPSFQIEKKKAFDSLIEQRQIVYDDIILELKTQFGDADFKKIDSYVMRQNTRRNIKGEEPWYAPAEANSNSGTTQPAPMGVRP